MEMILLLYNAMLNPKQRFRKKYQEKVKLRDLVNCTEILSELWTLGKMDRVHLTRARTLKIKSTLNWSVFYNGCL